MIALSLDTNLGILYLRPTPPLTSGDFKQLTEAVDPWIEDAGVLNAMIIEAAEFPGWDSFGAMLSHFRFALDHHRLIKKIAIVTNSEAGDVAEKFAAHFVAAEIKHFPAGQLEAAEQWAAA